MSFLQPNTALNGVTTVVTGDTIDLGSNFSDHTLIARTEIVDPADPYVSSSSAQLAFQGSHDGTHWVSMTILNPGGSLNLSNGSNPASLAFHVDAVIRYLRVNVINLQNTRVYATVASSL